MRAIWASFLLTVAGVGCVPKATFDVTIVNRTPDPLTVGIVKEGPPFEREFATPEDLAIRWPMDTPQWGHVIPPGGTMDSGRLTGAFPQGALAYLRVYRGERGTLMLNAMTGPNMNRDDVLLYPVPSTFVVEVREGWVKAVRVREGAATTREAAPR